MTTPKRPYVTVDECPVCEGVVGVDDCEDCG